jgi:solute carrier family 31 (copper transporter), member 1
MMHMTFYWGKNVTILFDSWRTTSWFGYLLSLFALLLASAFYQYMEDRRIRFKILAESNPASSDPSISTPLLHSRVLGGWSLARFATAVLFTVDSAIGYMLMLAVMSFNGGVFIAIVVGLGFGYLIFRSGEDEVLIKADNPCACA